MEKGYMRKLMFSIYPNNYKETVKKLPPAIGGSYVFTSCHIAETVSENFADVVADMFSEIRKKGYKIIADVSKKTLGFFGFEDIVSFQKHFDIDIIRIDYGYDLEEIISLAKETKVSLNASTFTDEELEILASRVEDDIIFIHNYYPKAESGLDPDYLLKTNEKLHSLGFEVACFFQSDTEKRLPMFEGLVTLEAHRGKTPLAQFVELDKIYSSDYIICGDGPISDGAFASINSYIDEDIVGLEVEFFKKEHEKLLGSVFTIRKDSPKTMRRLVESREYACFGERIEEEKSLPRNRGSVCVDNQLFKRYSGEITILTSDYPKSERVNVIGKIKQEEMIEITKIASKIKFI